MLRIQVLGPGCANCRKLEALAREAVAGLGVEAEVEKVSDMREIMARGVMATPGLAVNDKLVSTGRVPSASEVMTLIANVLAQDDAGPVRRILPSGREDDEACLRQSARP